MKLRGWQSECINLAISKFTNPIESCDFKKHFLALATPGAGKTIMAATLARKLYELGLIDLVLCFSPSSIVSSDFSDELSAQFKTEFNGKVGSLGDAFTYQRLGTLDKDTWRLFDRFRVFVIFDEIHHCAGSSNLDANAWGAPIIENIRDKAAFTISLTGTPWRSDALPIALSQYCDGQKIQCDYVYGLKEAIKDKVCRIPQIVAIDNDKIVINKTKERNVYNSFTSLLAAKATSYSKIVTDNVVTKQVTRRAIIKLDEIRKVNKNAGGLVIASSIEHAQKIRSIMWSEFGKRGEIVTTNEVKPSLKIKQFRSNSKEWLISVGMVSEGTNIPRLQVCCNLTNITTEMYFRQIFGRVLRKTGSPNQEAFMFMPAEPKLMSYAERMCQDIPDGVSKIKTVKMDEPIETEIDDEAIFDDVEMTNSQVSAIEIEDIPIFSLDEKESTQISEEENKSTLDSTWSMGIVGKYRQDSLKVTDLEPFLISEAAKDKLADLDRLAV
ncbi:DEAD/DEAH box helicase [Pseudoalteromonas undina]|uniref:DEAD/DEAH box helicase family protein n=1 Tax=Pseudoalteromonas undina TaxID=43660 RepID=A0ACC6R1Q5_9GAMM